MKLEPGSKLARYSLLEQLGQGGMGVVWKALDTTLDREIAIKVLAAERVGDERWLARFAHEARVVAALNHPNIVTIHSVETVDGIRFFTMELVRGRRLSQMIPLDGFALPELLDLAIPLAEAVAVAHARGIVHGDLKPGNVMVTEDGRVKVLDFGLARVEIKSPAGSISEISTQPFRSEGGISGTLPYMSPEQIRGDTIDQRSDIFSLGIMLHELSIGRRPFEGDTGMALAAAILRDDPPSLTGLRPEMPLHLGWLIGRCLAKEPRQRIQSARHLAEELEALKVGALAVGPDQPTIAVLPFVDLSAERDQEYFCEGLADETINALMRIEHLHVCSRGSSFQFKGMAMGAREVGRRLGVRTLLEGSVRKAGDRLRITAQLTSVADGYCLWSERFDRRLEDIFSIQEEIARSIVDALGVTLTPQERRNVGRVATSNVNAYDFYLRGRRFLNQYTRRGIEFARQMFTRAIEIDPGFAPGHAGLADCASYLFMYVKRDGRLLGEAEMASRRALEIDPELAHAHASLAVVLSLFRRAEEAESEFRRAIELGPRLFEAYFYYARECTLEGRFEEAARLYERAGQLQPEDCQAALLAVGAYERLGRTAEAQALRRRGANIAMERLRRNPDDIRSMYLAANALVMLGERERGLELAEKAVELGEDDAMLHYNVGCIFALAENADRALDCLEHAARVGNIQVSWYRHDSDLDSLRKLPRFQQLMEWLDAIQNEPASGD